MLEVPLPFRPIRDVITAPAGEFWFASSFHGLLEWRPDHSVATPIHHTFATDVVNDLVMDQDGCVWLATADGLMRFHRDRVDRYTKSDGLPHNHVNCLFEDRESNLWVGTRGGGLARLRDTKFWNFTTDEGLADDFTKCVLQDRSGTLWVGSHGGGLSTIRQGAIQNLRDTGQLDSHYIWSLAEDAEGLLWAGSARPARLHRIERSDPAAPETFHIQTIGPKQGLTIRGGIRALCPSRDGSLWMGGDGGGLARFHQNRFTVWTSDDGLPGQRILAQGFAGIAFQLEAVAEKLRDAPDQARQHLAVALHMVRHNLNEAKRTVMNLRARAVNEKDITATIRESTDQLIAGRPIDFNIDVKGTLKPLQTNLENNLIHVAQEAVTNALTHANPSRIDITIEFQHHEVMLQVQDNGNGFDPANGDQIRGRHFGLLGMTERARKLNARLDIQSSPGHGTCIRFEVPIP